MVKPADDQTLHSDACGEGDCEGQWQGHDQREGVVGDDLLNDIACVGPHHDEFAVGHVYDAHYTEGDGKADGCKEVDRRE